MGQECVSGFAGVVVLNYGYFNGVDDLVVGFVVDLLYMF